MEWGLAINLAIAASLAAGKLLSVWRRSGLSERVAENEHQLSGNRELLEEYRKLLKVEQEKNSAQDAQLTRLSKELAEVRRLYHECEQHRQEMSRRIPRVPAPPKHKE